MTRNNFAWRGGLAGVLLAALPALAVAADARIGVEGPRVERAREAARSLEAYFTLRNDSGHELRLLKAESPRARTVELKQRSYDASNKPHLWPVARLEVAAGGSARFSSTGRFFRLVDVADDVKPGDTVPLTLHFEDEPPLTIELVLVSP